MFGAILRSSTSDNCIAWQLMTPTVGGTIDSTFFAEYDATVQAALASGDDVYVILDLVGIDIYYISREFKFTAHFSTTTRVGMAPLSVKEGLPTTSLPVSGVSLQQNTQVMTALSCVILRN